MELEMICGRFRKGIAESIVIALISLGSVIITVVFEKETNYTITNFFYDSNTTKQKSTLPPNIK